MKKGGSSHAVCPIITHNTNKMNKLTNQQQNDSNLNKNDLDLNDHSYEKVVFRRVRILTLIFLP